MSPAVNDLILPGSDGKFRAGVLVADIGSIEPLSTLDPLSAPEPDIVYSGGTVNDAISQISSGGGTLAFDADVTFADTATARIDSQNATGVLRIAGITKPDGSKPILVAPLGTPWVFGDFDDVVIDNLVILGIGVDISGTGGGVSFNSLRFDRLDFGQLQNRALFVSRGPSALGPLIDPPGGTGDDPAETSYITITNTTMRDCTGPGNFTHSQYIDRRGLVFRADYVSVESIDPIEAFRSLGRVNIVTNSKFTNIVRESDGSLRKGREGAISEYGATPVDYPSCSAYILRNCEFDIYNGGGTVAAFGMRGRLSITCGDMPNNGDLQSLTDNVPWDQVEPVLGNPHLFPTFVEGCAFRFHGPVTGSSGIISGWGTYPRRHTDPPTSSSIVDYLAVPANWKERNVVFWKNNTVEGAWGAIHQLDLRQNKADTSDPDSWEPGEIPPVPFVETTAAFPQDCADLRAMLTWYDDPVDAIGGTHDGFPPCPA